MSSLSWTFLKYRVDERPSGFGVNIPFLEEEVAVWLPLGPDKEQTIVSRPLGAPKAGQEVAQPALRELNFYSAPEHLKKLFPVKSECF